MAAYIEYFQFEFELILLEFEQLKLLIKRKSGRGSIVDGDEEAESAIADLGLDD